MIAPGRGLFFLSRLRNFRQHGRVIILCRAGRRVAADGALQRGGSLAEAALGDVALGPRGDAGKLERLAGLFGRLVQRGDLAGGFLAGFAGARLDLDGGLAGIRQGRRHRLAQGLTGLARGADSRIAGRNRLVDQGMGLLQARLDIGNGLKDGIALLAGIAGQGIEAVQLGGERVGRDTHGRQALVERFVGARDLGGGGTRGLDHALGLAGDGFVERIALGAQVADQAFQRGALGGQLAGQVAGIVGGGIAHRLKAQALVADLAGHGLHGGNDLVEGAFDLFGAGGHPRSHGVGLAQAGLGRVEQLCGGFEHQRVGRRTTRAFPRHEARHQDQETRQHRDHAASDQGDRRLAGNDIEVEDRDQGNRQRGPPHHGQYETGPGHPSSGTANDFKPALGRDRYGQVGRFLYAVTHQQQLIRESGRNFEQ